MVKPEKMEEAVDEIWKGKKNSRIFADIVPRQKPKPEKTREVLPAVKQEPAAAPPARIGKPPRPDRGRFWLKAGAILLVIAVLIAAALIFLPQADIAVILKKSPVNFEEKIEGRKDIFEPRLENGKILIPGELLSSRKNLELLFSASGREEVAIKARGKLTIYNSFSSQPQILVANTRFLSPEGKIFRLANQVTVPGAKVTNGQIVPSSIAVDVVADKAGADYNLETSAGQWRIPGFSGTPRYEKFYAEAATPLAGGFVGEKAVPTKDDVAQGKAKIEETLREALRSEMAAVEDDLIFLEGTADFRIIKTEVDETADENGQFGIFAEAEMKQIGFDETILKEAVAAKLKAPLEEGLDYNLMEKNFAVEHGRPVADLGKGTISWIAKGSVVFLPPFDAGRFKNEILGNREEQLKEKTFAIAGLERATINLWPFWVHRVPSRLNRISVTVE